MNQRVSDESIDSYTSESKKEKKCVKLYSDILIPACVNESIPERSVKQGVNEEGEEKEG